jgi:hypothetical protein
MIDDECWENMAPPLDDTPRRLAPSSFTAHCEREPGRLQLRLVLARDEHVDDIVVDEDDDRIVAFAAVEYGLNGNGAGDEDHVDHRD